MKNSKRRRFANITLRFCDSMLTAALRPREPRARAYLSKMLSRRTRHFDRPAAALNFIDALLPGASRLWERAVIRGSRLPFRFETLAPLAHGNGTTVYGFQGPRGRYVYKVQRASLGLSLPALRAFARERLDKFEGVLSHYGAAADAFPPSHFMVAHGPLFGAAAVVTMQPLVTGPTRDILEGVDDHELAGLLERQPGLRRQVAVFAERTIAAWEGGARWIVDLGRNNLLLVGPPGEMRLVYLDAEMLEVAGLKSAPQTAHYERVVERMRGWLQRFGEHARVDEGMRPAAGM